MPTPTNREILEGAGLYSPDPQMTQQQIDAIESLTSEEVEALISAKAKLGPTFRDTTLSGGPRAGALLE